LRILAAVRGVAGEGRGRNEDLRPGLLEVLVDAQDAVAAEVIRQQEDAAEAEEAQRYQDESNQTFLARVEV